MSLIVQTISLPAVYTVSPDAAGQRARVIQRSQSVTEVTTAQEQHEAVAIATLLQSYIRAVEETRKSLTAPFDDAKSKLIALERDHLGPIKAEKERLGRLVTEFQRVESERVAREEAERQAEYQRLEKERQEALQRAERARTANGEAKAEIAAYNAEQAQNEILYAVAPRVEKAKGATTRQVMRFEVVDAEAVFKAHPYLCKVEVSASAVNATCNPAKGSTALNPDTSIPGLKVWWEDKTVFSKQEGGVKALFYSILLVALFFLWMIPWLVLLIVVLGYCALTTFSLFKAASMGDEAAENLSRQCSDVGVHACVSELTAASRGDHWRDCFQSSQHQYETRRQLLGRLESRNEL